MYGDQTVRSYNDHMMMACSETEQTVTMQTNLATHCCTDSSHTHLEVASYCPPSQLADSDRSQTQLFQLNDNSIEGSHSKLFIQFLVVSCYLSHAHPAQWTRWRSRLEGTERRHTQTATTANTLHQLQLPHCIKLSRAPTPSTLVLPPL